MWVSMQGMEDDSVDIACRCTQMHLKVCVGWHARHGGQKHSVDIAHRCTEGVSVG